ncbi:hypothetical protein [Campylobacter jejuni]|uniref:Uncharacterized protein n=1 Tax=Campylobacter jejuni TaxID=197 RepID=A0A431FVM3_CAMJU|nr:hypothetical protein [Campylobacter jejuni]RTJ97559.1 hypothetical protein C3H48_08485 [Campylobacter jejuni]
MKNENLREKINSLSKKEWKEFLFLREHVKSQNLGKTCEASDIFLKDIKDGEIYASYIPCDDGARVELRKIVYLEDGEFEEETLKSVEIQKNYDLQGDDITDYYALELYKIIENFKK